MKDICTNTTRLTVSAIALVLVAGLGGEASAQCGKSVQVQPGDTLSAIAQRCDVTEAEVLKLNPRVQGSNDLKAGMTLALVAKSPKGVGDENQSLLGRLKDYATEAGQKIEEGAHQVRTSVEELIQQNPDLHQRVRKIGQRLNIPGLGQVDAQVSLSVRRGPPGTPVTLSAIGLPPDQSVDIAGGASEAEYQIIESARTSSNGTLQATVKLPQWADHERDFIFVIASPDHDIAARSGRFDVEAPRSTR